MNVKINLNQPQEKCLVDLFNATNAGRLGLSLTTDDVVFGTPREANAPNTNTEISMEAVGSANVRGTTTVRYRRLSMQEAPLPSNGLIITLTSNHNSTASLAKDISRLMGIHLKESDIVSEPLSVKTMPYGITTKQIRIHGNCLVFRGELSVKLVREEPVALHRTDVMFPSFTGIEKQHLSTNFTHEEQIQRWEQAVAGNTTNAYLTSLEAIDEDLFKVLSDEARTKKKGRRGWTLESDPLAYWYSLYPESRPEE